MPSNDMTNLFEKLYSIERLIAALQKKPHLYAGILLYANESHTLKLIAQQEGISQAEISEQTYRTKGATSNMVDKLVIKGLVNRQREEGNQRRYLLTLTELGREVHNLHIAYDEKQAGQLLKGLDLSEEELAAGNQLLSKIIEFYSQRDWGKGGA